MAKRLIRNVIEEDYSLGCWYLRETAGDEAVHKYLASLGSGQRIGQAFFNSLTNADQDKLRYTGLDPFYGGQPEVYKAIDFLTR